MNDRDLYEQGMRDYINGVSQSNNPYGKKSSRNGGPGDYDFEAWRKGWGQARDIKCYMDILQGKYK